MAVIIGLFTLHITTQITSDVTLHITQLNILLLLSYEHLLNFSDPSSLFGFFWNIAHCKLCVSASDVFCLRFWLVCFYYKDMNLFLSFQQSFWQNTGVCNLKQNTLICGQKILTTYFFKTMWKYFQNSMYSFRGNWEMNLPIWHTVPHFNPVLFTIFVW